MEFFGLLRFFRRLNGCVAGREGTEPRINTLKHNIYSIARSNGYCFEACVGMAVAVAKFAETEEVKLWQKKER